VQSSSVLAENSTENLSVSRGSRRRQETLDQSLTEASTSDEHPSGGSTAPDSEAPNSLMRRLAGMDFNGKIVPDGTAAQSLKTLILLVNSEPIAVVLPETARISFSKVALHLRQPKASVCLAPPGAVPKLSGFSVGSVPPVGHFPHLQTLVDSGQFSGEVAGGCGDPNSEMLTTWEAIKRARHCEPADIIK